MGEVRALKGESQPAFEEKLDQLKQLRQLRESYQTEITTIVNNLKGLDCKSEAELDSKIREFEEKIASGTAPIREERQIVQNISKLSAQREKIREYTSQEARLATLKTEKQRVSGLLQFSRSVAIVIARLHMHITFLYSVLAGPVSHSGG